MSWRHAGAFKRKREPCIYSVRNALGRELWWTTARRKAFEYVELHMGLVPQDWRWPWYVARLVRCKPRERKTPKMT